MVLAAPQAPMWSARSSWWRGAPVEASGVKVERPEPQARTNDLDAAGGRRRLGVWTTGWVVTRGGGCSHRVPRVGGGWGGQVRLPRHLFASPQAHDAIVGTDQAGLNQLADSPAGAGGHAW